MQKSQGRGFLYRRRGSLANDVMVVTHPLDLAMRYALNRAVSNIEGRQDANVWSVTGPGILTEALNQYGPTHDLFSDIELGTVEQVREWVEFHWELEYKSRPSDWRKTGGSIYRD